MSARLAVYEGFPDGVSDGFCRHAAVATSQYGTTARALAAEVLALREELALVRVHRDIHRDYRLRAEATLATIRALCGDKPLVLDSSAIELAEMIQERLDAAPKET